MIIQLIKVLKSEEMLVKWHLSIPFGKYGVYHKRMLKSLECEYSAGRKLTPILVIRLIRIIGIRAMPQRLSVRSFSLFHTNKAKPCFAEVDQNTASVSLLRLGFKFLTRKENIKNARGRLIAEDTYLLEKSEIRNQQSKMIK
jgi:hypothetical protein